MNNVNTRRLVAATAALLLCSTATLYAPTGTHDTGSLVASADSYSGTLGSTCSYSFDSDSGTLTIAGTGDTPDCSNGSSAVPWYSYRSQITSVVVKDGVTGIGNYTFAYCYYVESVTLPESLTSIGVNAFWECESLSEVTIPSSVQSVSSGAFIGCTALQSIEVESGNANYVSVDGVLYDSSLETLVQYPSGSTRTEYTVPDGVTTVLSGAFAESVNLTSVTLPDSVSTAGGGVFYGCTALTDVTLSKRITNYTYYYQYFGVAIWKGFFDGCTKLESVRLPDGAITIGPYAFSNCDSLKEFTVGDSVTTIDSGAFIGCDSLTTVTLGKKVSDVNVSAFDYCTNLTDILVADGSTTYSSIDGVLFDADGKKLVVYPYGRKDTSYTIPDGVTSVGYYAFCENEYLESVTLPSSVDSLGSYAFAWCESLMDVDFLGDVAKVSIGNRALYGTPYYESLQTDGGYYITPEGVLLGVDSTVLSSSTIEVPASVRYVSSNVFNGTCSAESIVFDSDVQLSSSAFYWCENLQSVTVHGDCTTACRTFKYCSEVSEFTVDGNLTCEGSIGLSSEATVTHGRTLLDYSGVSTDARNLLADSVTYTIDSVPYDTCVAYSKYRVFGSLDTLQEVSDTDGNVYAVCGYRDSATLVSQYGDSVTLEKDGYTFGCATIGDDDYLYVLWGMDVSEDVVEDSMDVENVVIDKYSLDGTLVQSLGIPLRDTEAQYPFDAGNANIAYSGGYLGVVFDTEWLMTSDGYHHQGSDFVKVNANTMEVLGIDTLSMSHSFGVSTLTSSYGFDVLQRSDAGPRGLNLMRYYNDYDDGSSTPYNDYSRVYHCSGQYGTNSSQLDGNYTYTYMGGFARSNSTYAVVGKSERVYTSDVYFDSGIGSGDYDVFVKIADSTLIASASADCAGVDRYDEATGEVADSNVVWLTQCDATHQAGEVKVVTLPSGAYCVLWESLIDGKFDSVQYVILDELGNVLREQGTVEGARLSDTSVQPIVQGNTLTWAVADSSDDSVTFYSVDVESKASSTILGDLDGSGTVDYLDLLRLKKHVLGVTHSSLRNGDLNGDGSIDVLDVLTMKSTILNG